MDLYIYKNVWWIVGKQTVVLTHLKPDFHWKKTLLNVLKALRFLAIFWGLQGNLSNSSTMSSKLIADVRLNWSNTPKVQIGSCFHTFFTRTSNFFSVLDTSRLKQNSIYWICQTVVIQKHHLAWAWASMVTHVKHMHRAMTFTPWR